MLHCNQSKIIIEYFTGDCLGVYTLNCGIICVFLNLCVDHLFLGYKSSTSKGEGSADILWGTERVTVRFDSSRNPHSKSGYWLPQVQLMNTNNHISSYYIKLNKLLSLSPPPFRDPTVGLQSLYEFVRSSLSSFGCGEKVTDGVEEWGSPVLLVDDLSVLLSLGVRVGAVLDFSHYCRATVCSQLKVGLYLKHPLKLWFHSMNNIYY